VVPIVIQALSYKKSCQTNESLTHLVVGVLLPQQEGLKVIVGDVWEFDLLRDFPDPGTLGLKETTIDHEQVGGFPFEGFDRLLWR